MSIPFVINFREPEVVDPNPDNVQIQRPHQSTSSMLTSYKTADSAAESGDLDTTDGVSTQRNPAYEDIHLLHQYDTINCTAQQGGRNPMPNEEGYRNMDTFS